MTFVKGHHQNDGKNNPRFIDGRRYYPTLVDLSRCAICGKKADPNNSHSIEAHHRDGNRANNDPSNLIALCNTGPDSCHRKRRAVKNGNIIADVSECQFPTEVTLDGGANQ